MCAEYVYFYFRQIIANRFVRVDKHLMCICYERAMRRYNSLLCIVYSGNGHSFHVLTHTHWHAIWQCICGVCFSVQCKKILLREYRSTSYLMKIDCTKVNVVILSSNDISSRIDSSVHSGGWLERAWQQFGRINNMANLYIVEVRRHTSLVIGKELENFIISEDNYYSYLYLANSTS